MEFQFELHVTLNSNPEPMEFQFPFNFIFLVLFLSFLFLVLVEWKKSRNLSKKLPPSLGIRKWTSTSCNHKIVTRAQISCLVLTENTEDKCVKYVLWNSSPPKLSGPLVHQATTIWAMTEMMKNPRILTKAQAEVREAFKGKETFNEDVIEDSKYLKQVVKENLRLHPAIPLLIPRECREETNINGYTIPLKTNIPKYWEDAKSFMPERFEQSSVDFMGNNFEYLSFGNVSWNYIWFDQCSSSTSYIVVSF